MDDLISRQAAIDIADDLRAYISVEGYWAWTERLGKLPSIDAVPVVRCKDCNFNYANQIPSEDVCQLCVELPITGDFFCARVERRENNV